MRERDRERERERERALAIKGQKNVANGNYILLLRLSHYSFSQLFLLHITITTMFIFL